MMCSMYQLLIVFAITISVSLVVVVTAQFDGFGEKKVCKPYSCPKDHEPVPKWPLQLSSTGCSSMGGMQIFGNINDDDDPMRICCDLRNACIQTCGSIKSFCDDEFIQCGKDICINIQDDDMKTKCEKSASINDIMVKMDNCQRYDQAQYTHCECVSKDIVQKKRERVIRAFYKKFNPNHVDKVTTLIQKVDTPAKMVGLLLKLYKKYPTVIQKIKDPQQEMMEKMMKEGREKNKDTTKTQQKEEESSDDNEPESDAEDLGVDEL